MAIQPITIYVNGQELEGWKSFNVTRSIVSFCGSFSLVTTNRTNFPLRIFTDIKVLINGKVVMNGYINRITKNKSVSGESGTHDITVSGSDNTIDLQQSSMAEGITINASGLTFKQLIEAVLKKLNFSNVKVIDEVGDVETFKAVEDIYSDYGTKYYDFLETYARQRQVLLNTNREGNIVIRRANLTKALNTIVDGDNSNTTNGYISKTINMDGTKIFYKYICYSIYADILDEIGVSDESKYLFVHKESTENIEAIRKTRIEVFQAESVTDSLNLQRRADWEKSFRRSEAYQPEYKVQGFSPAD
ncbi:MAG TPA: hypothetical protein VMV86_00425, partial [Methanosarcinales archaeon]|nr:hypothetical protein [Methanosarcinales archaeon]